MKKMMIIALIFIFWSSLYSQIGTMISSERLPALVDGELPWQKAGYISHLGDEVIGISKYINVMDLGASGDGVADDTQFILDAIEEAQTEADSGGFTVIYFPEGFYIITETLYLCSNVAFKGAGSNLTLIEFSILDDDYIRIQPVSGDSVISNVGIEDLKLIRDDDNDNSSYSGHFLRFDQARNCWLRGVESYHASRHHVYITYSENIEISGNYFHSADSYGGGGYGYGIQIGYYSAKCLVENNIFRRLRHAMLLGDSAHHNVYGYNYSYDQHTDQDVLGVDWVTGDMCLHGHNDTGVLGPYENLFEGNIGSFVIIDDSHGSNGDYNTIFRNKGGKVGLEIESGNNNQNIVNNYFKCDYYVLSNILGYSWLVDGSNHLKKNNKCKNKDFWGNWDTFWRDHDSSYNADISYYHEEQPAFLENYSWPFSAIDDDNPAKDRKDEGLIRTVYAGYNNYGIYCSGNAIAGDDPGNNSEISVMFIKQDSIYIMETSPLADGTYILLIPDGCFGLYKLEFSLPGYETIIIDSVGILPYQEIPEISDVMLNYINIPPNIAVPLLDLSLQEDFTDFDINLNLHFADHENDSIYYSVEYDSVKVACSIEDSLLTLSSYLNWNGITEIIVTADDGQDRGVATDSFLVQVTPVNDDPQLMSPLPDLYAESEYQVYELDLSDYFYDLDDSLLNYLIEFDSLLIECNLIDSLLSINRLLCWPAETTIEICAGDGHSGYSICDTIFVFDDDIGMNPTFLQEPIEDFTFLPYYDELVIELNEHFYDCDGDSLVYRVYFNINQIDCEINEEQLRLNYVEDWLGDSFINVTSNDEVSGTLALDGFTVTVIPDSLMVPNITSVEVIGDSVRIFWNAVDYADFYMIYSTDEPFGEAWILEADNIIIKHKYCITN